jgi:AAA15 family ATPase/GTPase
MLINFNFSNFKSIQDEVNLSCSANKDEEDENFVFNNGHTAIFKTAIIYGQNASGKTNILKALEFLKRFVLDAPLKKTDTINITPFIFTNDIKENSSFEVEFLQNNIRYLYQLALNKNKIVAEKLYFYNPNKALVYDRISQKFGSKIKLTKSQKESLFNNTIENNTLLSGYLKTNIEIEAFDDVLDWFKRVMNPIYPHTDLLGFVSNVLKNKAIDNTVIIGLLKNADFAIDDFEIQEKEIDEEFKKFLIDMGKSDDIDHIIKIEILFTHYQKYKLEFQSESMGTQRFYQLVTMLYLALKENRILLIDEIESSLHPDLLKHFLLIFLANTKESQLIFTTHSRELLMEKDLFRYETIYFTEKRANGSTDLFSLKDFDSKTIRKENSIFNIYKSGKLGAIPNTKNYFLDL